MTLRLSIENIDRLPDGGPVRIEVKGRGLDLGRDSHLDWTLPDPGRSISGKHCEIRYRDGEYWLHDVSTNGTFVNGADYRLDAPHLLRDGDRLNIGPYFIAVAVEDGRTRSNSEAAETARIPRDVNAANVWAPFGEAAPPGIAGNRQAPQQRNPAPDFLDFASFLEAPKLAQETQRVLRSEDHWLTAAAPVSAPPLDPDALEQRMPTPTRPAIGDPGLRQASRSEPQSDSDAGLNILNRVAQAAGLPSSAFSSHNSDALADEIGGVLRLMAENLRQMLASRAESKTLMRSSSRTMIRATENNPLKFASSPEEALGIMFGPSTRNYLDARTAVEDSFSDLKTHQILTYSAMQSALDALFEDLAPEKIDHSVEPERGIGALVSSRKAKLWDIYTERWRAKTKRADGRLLEAFTALFAEAYDKLQEQKS